MKKLIYLPLIALIILSGCKGNSFITQRYTHLKHSPPQTVVLTKMSEKTSPLYAGEGKAGDKTNTQVAAKAPAATGATASPTTKKYSVTVRNADEELILIKRKPSLSKPAIGKAEATSVLQTGYTSVKTYMQSDGDGVINTTLKFVLFIVGLVIVVALIIILVVILG